MNADYTLELQVLKYRSDFLLAPLAAVNLKLVNISSTALSMNWTQLPSQFHNGILLGYKAFISNLDSQTGTFTALTEMSFSPNEFHQLMTNLSKWTTYCAFITAFTAVGNGPRSTRECTRTFEDGKTVIIAAL